MVGPLQLKYGPLDGISVSPSSQLTFLLRYSGWLVGLGRHHGRHSSFHTYGTMRHIEDMRQPWLLAQVSAQVSAQLPGLSQLSILYFSAWHFYEKQSLEQTKT